MWEMPIKKKTQKILWNKQKFKEKKNKKHCV